MIVIATHNGTDCLKALIQRLEDFQVKEEILIVDTQSEDHKHLEYLDTLCYKVTQTPERNFDTGAYIWAYQNFPAENYHFFHDSQNIKHPDFFDIVNEKLKISDVVAYGWFEESYDEAIAHPSQNTWKDFFEQNVPEQKYSYGIFGPMFSIRKSALDKLPLNNLCLPYNKITQCAYERIWPMLFEKYNLNVDLWEKFLGHDFIAVHPHIEKTFLNRQ